MANGPAFSRIMEEYGNLEKEEDDETKAAVKKKKKEGEDVSVEEAGAKKGNAALMQNEERNTGAVTWSVYTKYLRFAGGVVWAPVILSLLFLSQGAQGLNPSAFV